MSRHIALCGLAAALAFAGATPAFGADGPCSDDIAQLSRQLGNKPGLGAPISEPAAGLSVGAKSGGQTGGADVSSNDKAQGGGASLTGGGSPGTVGGVAGTMGGSNAAKDNVANGRIATSDADVRRQSAGQPTTAQQAAKDNGKPDSQTNAAVDQTERNAEAKNALQQAAMLNAKGDASCKTAVNKARDLMGHS